jgi:lipoate-protein ligase A
MMKFLDYTAPTPAENLACDEALLDLAEEQGGDSVLRFWESPRHFVVLGYANKAAEEADLEACRAADVPVLRRCSGGGTVLQGPGCVNYAVVLRIDSSPELGSITGANRYVMERNRDAMSRLLGREVRIEGHTDLAVGPLKFSGNAQRRKREWLLFHGTVLIDFNLSLVPKLLRHPSREPDYRGGRSHEEFVTTVAVTRDNLKATLSEVWGVSQMFGEPPSHRIAELVASRYARDEWNFSR